MHTSHKQSGNTLVTTIIGIVVVVAVVFFVMKYTSGTTQAPVVIVPTAPTPTPTKPTVPGTTPAPVVPLVKKPVASVYKDGTYSADGSYNSPAGVDTLHVSVTIKNDVVTGSTVTTVSARGESQQFINDFIDTYAPYVTGKPISTLNLTKISGASLTPAGFNNALAKIKAQAKA